MEFFDDITREQDVLAEEQRTNFLDTYNNNRVHVALLARCFADPADRPTTTAEKVYHEIPVKIGTAFHSSLLRPLCGSLDALKFSLRWPLGVMKLHNAGFKGRERRILIAMLL